MKDEDKKKNDKPTARPIVYFKDFEKRFDDLLTKNRTPRAESTIQTATEDTHRSHTVPEELSMMTTAKKR